MKLHLRSLAFAAFTLCLGAPAPAALDSAIVAAEARWVFYADLNTMRSTAIGKELIALSRQKEFASAFDRLALNLDKTLETIGSITAYGDDSPDGVLLLQGTADLRKILEGMLLGSDLGAPGKVVVTELKDFPFPAYSISDASQKPAAGAELIVAFPPEPIVLAGRSKARLLKAREVYNHTAESLQKAPASPMSQLVQGATDSYVFGASVMLPGKEQLGNGPQARLFQLATAACVALGEKGPDTVLNARLLAGSEATAVKLLKIAEGLTAMLSLGESQDKDIEAFLNAVTVQKDRQTVTIGMAYPSERLLRMIRQITSGMTGKPGAKPEPPAQPPKGTVRLEANAEPAGFSVTLGAASQP